MFTVPREIILSGFQGTAHMFSSSKIEAVAQSLQPETVHLLARWKTISVTGRFAHCAFRPMDVSPKRWTIRPMDGSPTPR